MMDPSPQELAAAVETARRLGWNQDDITLSAWITLKVKLDPEEQAAWQKFQDATKPLCKRPPEL